MTVRQSLRFSTVLGDWSDDGHGKTRTTEIEVFTDDESVKLTEELVRSNYEANVAKLGFGIGELWENYEQSSVLPSQAEAIQRELGARYYGDTELIELYSELSIEDADGLPNRSNLDFGSFELEDNEDGFFIEDQLEFVLFIVLQGIPGVGWRELKSTQLFGTWDPLLGKTASSVGYGLFY